MKILILAAMDKEINLLINLLGTPNEVTIEGNFLYEGMIGSNQIYIGKCGIGKVNSALNAFRLITDIKPDLLINSGVAGGAGIPIGSILFADKIAYHDVWCGPGTNYGQAEGTPLFMIPSQKVMELVDEIGKSEEIVKGLICSGDRFISKAEEIKDLRSHFPEVKAVDMESASIAQTCILTATPFAIIRVVSDTPGEGENISQYKNFWSTAPEKTFHLLESILEKL